MSEIQPTLSVVALAWQEGEQLRKCFRSLKPLLERAEVESLVVLDAGADEQTARIAHEVADRVVVTRFENFSKQRNRGLDFARGAWVFFIDSDERITPALAQETLEALERPLHAAYRVPRRNIFFGREVRHTGWYPDYQVRLLQRSKCRYDESRDVHELPAVGGATGTLNSPLIHYNYSTWRQFARKQLFYAPLEARALYKAGHRARPRSFVGQPLREFKRRFVDYEGYKDGTLGLALSLAMSAYTLLTYLHLWRLQRSRQRSRS